MKTKRTLTSDSRYLAMSGRMTRRGWEFALREAVPLIKCARPAKPPVWTGG